MTKTETLAAAAALLTSAGLDHQYFTPLMTADRLIRVESNEMGLDVCIALAASDLPVRVTPTYTHEGAYFVRAI